MRTVSINLYSINELSDSVKAKVLDKYRYEFCEYTADDVRYDAKECSDLDIDRYDIEYNYIYCSFRYSAERTAQTVLQNHGVLSTSYSSAKKFLAKLAELESQPDDAKTEMLVDELEELFLVDMSEYYFNLLKNEYEDCTSDEYIIDMLEANDYEFTEDGNRYKK